MHLSTHTAQASNHASTRTRGWSPKRRSNLDVTTAVPATEMLPVAEAAPATVLATAPTVLRRLLRRLADGSRPSTPEGSQPAYAWSPVPTPIRPITGRLSLCPSSSARRPIGSPCGALSQTGGRRVYHVASPKPRGLGPVSTPVARHLRRGSSEPPDLATYLLVQARTAPWAWQNLRRLRRFTWVDLTTPCWSPTALVLAVATLAHASVAIRRDEDTLSRGLRTSPLPGTHAAVADDGQNRRCCHLLSKSNTGSMTPSCRTRTCY
jgi:hypothetical protein